MRIKLLFLLIICAREFNSQSLYPDDYSRLFEKSGKGSFNVFDEAPNGLRYNLYNNLRRIDDNKNNLTLIDKSNLSFYLKEYFLESQLSGNANSDTSYMGFFKNDPLGRLRVFYYSDELFKIALDPIYGYARGFRDGKSTTHFWSGLSFYGYLGRNVNFYFNYRDNSESGETIDRDKHFTPDNGVNVYGNKPKSIEYSEVRTGVSYFWQWGSFSVMKDYMEWGYGESGKLVMSTKAPSLPMIRLDIYPVDWLQFNYFHAWLASDVIDSALMYNTSIDGHSRTVYRDKFIASHSFIIHPAQGLSIAIGESIVYSDQLKFAYLQPLMFFRLADHYLSRANNDAGDNSQFFAQVSAKGIIPNTHLYASALIDEVKIGELFNPEKQRNQFGFTVGGSVYDLPLENLSASLEYTKIYPFVYKHHIPTLTYESASYTMGHWIGQNADIIYGSFKYNALRGLQIKAWGFYVRKGEEGTAVQQWDISKPQPPFLHGLRTNYTQLGFEAKFEFIHNLFLRGEFIYNNISREQSRGIFIDDKYNELSLAVYYGL